MAAKSNISWTDAILIFYVCGMPLAYLAGNFLEVSADKTLRFVLLWPAVLLVLLWLRIGGHI
jgi:hypothetical protein